MTAKRPHKDKTEPALQAELRQLEDQFQELRRHHGKTREDAHDRIDARRTKARVELSRAEAEFRHNVVSRPLNAGDAATLATLWLEATDDQFAAYLHSVIDREPSAGQGDPFTAMSKADYQARHTELRNAIAELEAEQVEREAQAEMTRARSRISKIRERAAR